MMAAMGTPMTFQSTLASAMKVPTTNAPSTIEPEITAEAVTIVEQLQEDPRQVAAAVVGTVQVLLPLAGLVDVEALKAKLNKDLGKIEAEAKGIEGRLSNPNFVERAPAEVVATHRTQLEELEQQQQILRDRLRKLG